MDEFYPNSLGAQPDFLDYLEEAVKTSRSFVEVGRKLEIQRWTVAKYIRLFNLDISHFRGAKGRPPTAESILSRSEKRRNGVVKPYVIDNKLIPYECSKCGLGPEWNGKTLVLQLEHKDGDYTNNVLENLTFLCPNCHSQTEHYVGNHRRNKGSGTKPRKEYV